MRLMTWRAPSISPYCRRIVGDGREILVVAAQVEIESKV